MRLSQCFVHLDRHGGARFLAVGMMIVPGTVVGVLTKRNVGSNRVELNGVGPLTDPIRHKLSPVVGIVADRAVSPVGDEELELAIVIHQRRRVGNVLVSRISTEVIPGSGARSTAHRGLPRGGISV